MAAGPGVAVSWMQTRPARAMKFPLLLSALLGLMAMPAGAVIIGGNVLEVDFTDPEDARAKAAWSPPQMDCTAAGLGWEGKVLSDQPQFIETKPLAVGLYWRPPQGVGISVSVEMPTGPLKQKDGSEQQVQPGRLYVRYSADAKHWSDWQLLPQDMELWKKGKAAFKGEVAIPTRLRAPYNERLLAYAQWVNKEKPDLWASNEEEAVRWIVAKEPDYFRKQIPLIGYVQFLYEGTFLEARRVKGLKIYVNYATSGLASPHPNPEEEKNRTQDVWSYRAEGALEPVPLAKPRAKASE